MQLRRRNVNLDDVKITGGCQGKECTERRKTHNRGEGLTIIDAGMLMTIDGQEVEVEVVCRIVCCRRQAVQGLRLQLFQSTDAAVDPPILVSGN